MNSLSLTELLKNVKPQLKKTLGGICLIMTIKFIIKNIQDNKKRA